MKVLNKFILTILIVIFNFFYTQNIPNLDDKNLVSNLFIEYSKKAEIAPNEYVVFYFRKNPVINKVLNGQKSQEISKGYSVILNNYKSIKQIVNLSTEYDVYTGSKNIYYVFDKKCSDNILKRFQKRKLQIKSIPAAKSVDYHNPKTWTIRFDLLGKLIDCYPYNCLQDR